MVRPVFFFILVFNTVVTLGSEQTRERPEATGRIPAVWKMVQGTFKGDFQVGIPEESGTKWLTLGKKWMSCMEIMISGDRFMHVRGHNDFEVPEWMVKAAGLDADGQDDNEQLKSLWHLNKSGACRSWIYSNSGAMTNQSGDVKLEDFRVVLQPPKDAEVNPDHLQVVVFEFNEDGNPKSFRGETAKGVVLWRMANVARADDFPPDASSNTE